MKCQELIITLFKNLMTKNILTNGSSVNEPQTAPGALKYPATDCTNAKNIILNAGKSQTDRFLNRYVSFLILLVVTFICSFQKHDCQSKLQEISFLIHSQFINICRWIFFDMKAYGPSVYLYFVYF